MQPGSGGRFRDGGHPGARSRALLLTILVGWSFVCLDYRDAFPGEYAEILRYEMLWNGNKAAHGDITTKVNSHTVDVIAQVVSDGALKTMVEIWSQVKATFAAKSFAPQTYRYHLKSNRLRPELVDLNFDHSTQLVQIDKILGESRESHSEKFSGLYDPITAVFLLRNQKDLTKPLYVDIFDGRDKARLYVSPCGIEQCQTRIGAHPAYGLDLRLLKMSGDRNEIATAKLWISTDERRIPLALTSSHLMGTFRFEIVQAQL